MESKDDPQILKDCAPYVKFARRGIQEVRARSRAVEVEGVEMKSTTRFIVHRQRHAETVAFDVAARPGSTHSPPTSADLEIGFVAVGA